MKPTESLLSNPYDGKEIKDKNGRLIRLKKPNALERYDMFSAMEVDAKNPMCLSFAIPLLHVFSIDGMIMAPPKSIREFRANLARLDDEGLEAIMEFMNSISENASSEQEQKEILKK